ERKPEDLRVEEELGLERAPLVLGHAKSMTLTGESEICEREALPAKGRDQHLRLRRRDDLVIEPLKHDHRPLQTIEEIHRRARAVRGLRLGIRTDESIEIARLELVRFPRQGPQVGDAVVARAR